MKLVIPLFLACWIAGIVLGVMGYPGWWTFTIVAAILGFPVGKWIYENW